MKLTKLAMILLLLLIAITTGVFALSTTTHSNVQINGELNKTAANYSTRLSGDLYVLQNNTSTGEVLYVNTTSGKVEVWNPAEGTGDYVSIYHDGTNGWIVPGSGAMRTQSLKPQSANNYDFGDATLEWRGLYLGEDASSGVHFGLDQDSRLWYNSTSNVTELISTNVNSHVDIVAPDLRVWDDAMATNDYVSVYHDGTAGYVTSASGNLQLDSGNYITAADGIIPTAANTKTLGGTNAEWQSLYSGEDAGSGIYFGLDQDWHMFYNETIDDSLWLEGVTDISIATTDLKVWDDAKASGDYLQILHDSSNAFIQPGSGYVSLRNSAGADRVVASTSGAGFGGQTSPAVGVHVGTGSSSHSLATINDTFVTGKLEVDGIVHADSSVYQYSGEYFQDDIRINLGTGSDSLLEWDTGQATENTALWSLGATARSIIFGDYATRTKDYDHPAQSNPTLFIQSATDPDTQNTQWVGISQEGNTSVIDSGSDNIELSDNTRIEGNITSSDAEGIGSTVFSINGDSNSIDLVTDSSHSVDIVGTQLNVWDDAKGANDYVSLYHDGSNAYVSAVSGILAMRSSSVNLNWDGTQLYGGTANTRDLGVSTAEWRGIYAGEDASSGVYFGLDQDTRIWYNSTSNITQLKSTGATTNSFDVVTPIGLNVWDDAEGAGDHVRISHDGSNGIIQSLSGTMQFATSSGVSFYQTGTTVVPAIANTRDFGNSALVWRSVYIGNGTSSGAYFGLGQESGLLMSDAQATAPTMVWGLPGGARGNSLVLASNTYLTSDYDHPSQSNPTLFVQSETNPDTNNTQWGSISHDTSSVVIDSGSDSIVLDDTTHIAGDAVIGDNQVGTTAFTINDDGTYVRLDAQSNKNIKIITPTLEVWDDAEATNDYVSVYHDGSNGYVIPKTGVLFVGGTDTTLAAFSNTQFYPASANLRDMGTTAYEWRALYLGEDAGSGIYFGSDQDFRFLYNETSSDQLQVTTTTGNILKINKTGEMYLLNGGMIYDNSTCLILKSPDGTGTVNVCNT